MRYSGWLNKNRLQRDEWRYLAGGLLLLDLIGVFAAQWLAYQVRFVWGILPYGWPSPSPELYLNLAFVLVPVWLLLFAVHGLYRAQNLLGGVKEYALLVNATTYGVVAVVVLGFFSRPEGSLARGWLVLVWLLSVLILGVLRFAVRRVVFFLRRQGFFIRQVIVAGADEQGVTLAAHLGPSDRTGLKVVGFVHDYLAPGSVVRGELRVLGEPMEIDVLTRRHHADLVIVVPGALSWESMQAVMKFAAADDAAFECRLLPGLYDAVASRVDVDACGPVPLLALNHLRITGVERLLKGSFDYFGSVFLLLLTLPVLALLALLNLSRPGPLFEVREFLGVRGRFFRALAFDGWWDGRVLRQRKGLERFFGERRLHRLPGLLNVLKGEMSLVGPRLLTAADLASNPRWRHNVLSVKPGLTGPWLLAGGEQLSLEESLRLDLYYVRNYSIWLDLQILFRTIVRLRGGFEHRTTPESSSSAGAETEPTVPRLLYQREG